MTDTPRVTTPLYVPLLKLHPKGCRYIPGDSHLYCGVPAEYRQTGEAGPYCDTHAKLLYRAPEGRVR